MSVENMKSISHGEIPGWFDTFNDQSRKERIWEIGLYTGWRNYPDGSFGAPNFERALILDRVIEVLEPKDVLEIGTGRGLGCITMASAARTYDTEVAITTVDLTPPDKKQAWAIRVDGNDCVQNTSLNDVWGERFDKKITENIFKQTGLTTEVLPRQIAEGKKYDFIFIDGGHDPYSVIHDLSCSIKLLRSDGVILMDDFAPLNEYGIGTCLAIPHARNWFENVEVFPTEGVVYGGSENEQYPRGMVLLSGLKKECNTNIRAFKLVWWKIVKRIFAYCYSSRSFPID